jgi:hypothetical protein
MPFSLSHYGRDPLRSCLECNDLFRFAAIVSTEEAERYRFTYGRA